MSKEKEQEKDGTLMIFCTWPNNNVVYQEIIFLKYHDVRIKWDQVFFYSLSPCAPSLSLCGLSALPPKISWPPAPESLIIMKGPQHQLQHIQKWVLEKEEKEKTTFAFFLENNMVLFRIFMTSDKGLTCTKTPVVIQSQQRSVFHGYCKPEIRLKLTDVQVLSKLQTLSKVSVSKYAFVELTESYFDLLLQFKDLTDLCHACTTLQGSLFCFDNAPGVFFRVSMCF